MQNRTYGDLFNLIQSLAGGNSFTTEESADISRFINRRFFTAFNKTNIWARYVVPSEERKISTFFIESVFGNTGNSDDYQNVHYYKIGTDNSLGNDVYVPINQTTGTPSTSLAFIKNSSKKWVWVSTSWTFNLLTKVWTFGGVVTNFATQQDTEDRDHPGDVVDWGTLSIGGTMVTTGSQTILYDETYDVKAESETRKQRNTINDFIRIHREKSFLNKSSIEYDYYVDNFGAHILNIKDTGDSSAFITYKKKFVKFTTSSDFGTSTEEVPEEFFQYIAHSAYADFLRMDGQTQKALVEEQNAEEALNLQLERSDIIFNINTLKKRFSTYINNQSR